MKHNRLVDVNPYLHLDGTAYSLMGTLEQIPELMRIIPELNHTIQTTLGSKCSNRFAKTPWKRQYKHTYDTGCLSVLYDRRWYVDDLSRKEDIAALWVSHSDKLDYLPHHYYLLAIEQIIGNYWKDFHLKHIEIAMDVYEREAGQQLFRAMVPKGNGRSKQGLEILTGKDPVEKWLPHGEHQYYGTKNNAVQYHTYPKQYRDTEIWRTELILRRKYLKKPHIDGQTWTDVLPRRSELLKNNIMLLTPRYENIQRDGLWRPEYEGWKDYPSARWLLDLQERTAMDCRDIYSKYFNRVEFPVCCI